MMGGGFGGCTINLVHNTAITPIKKIVSEQYKMAFDIDPLFYEVNIAEGASCSIFEALTNLDQVAEEVETYPLIKSTA